MSKTKLQFNQHTVKKIIFGSKEILEKELKINEFWNSKNISPELLNYKLEENNNKFVLTLEFKKFGIDLRQFINNYIYQNDEWMINQFYSIIFQIIKKVDLLHSYHISHNDLKPENILINELNNKDIEVLICDFGSSCYIKKNNQNFSFKNNLDINFKSFTNKFHNNKENFLEDKLILGTNGYISLEQYFDLNIDKNINFWSIGCIIYEMFMKIKNPFRKIQPYFFGYSSLSLNLNSNVYKLKNDNENKENINPNNKFSLYQKEKVNNSFDVSIFDPIIRILEFSGYKKLKKFINYLEKNNISPSLVKELNFMYEYLKKKNIYGLINNIILENCVKNDNLNLYLMHKTMKNFLNLIPKKREKGLKSININIINNN